MNEPIRCPIDGSALCFRQTDRLWHCPVCDYTQADDEQHAPIPSPEATLASKIETETEWNPSAAKLRDAILMRFVERLDALALKHPDKLNKAIAVIVQAGPGRTVLCISDPSTEDLVTELRRYVDSGSPSPLTDLLDSRLPI